MVNGGDSSDSLDTESIASKEVENRARSEERNQHRSRASPRSKSVDPYLGRRRKWLMVQSYPPVQVMMPLPVTTYEAPSGIPKTTEYRSQFIWLPSSETTPQCDATPKKSISMGAIQATQAATAAAAQQQSHAAIKPHDVTGKIGHPVDGIQKSALKGPTVTHEEPLIVPKRVGGHEAAMANVNLHDGDQPTEDTETEKQSLSKLKKSKTEYKAQFRAPSKYMFVDGGWKKMSRSADSADLQKELHHVSPWYGEVAELRKKAGEYKHRSIGGHILQDSKPSATITRQEMIEELSTRSTLSALALATTPSSAFKKSKELGIEGIPSSHRAPSTIRHHLDRTTLATGESGVLITSPTRDHKLEPVQIQKPTTPKDTKVSVGKGKPITKVTQKPIDSQPLSKSMTGTITVGKQVASGTHRSPKRTPRPMSMIVPGSKAQVPAINGTGGETPRKPEVKRPRPTSLVTSSAPMRPKPIVSSRSAKAAAHGEEHIINGDSKAKHAVAAVHAPASLAKATVPASHVDVKPAQPAISPPELSSEAKPIKDDVVMVNGENGKSETDETPDDETKQLHRIPQSESQEIVETMMMKSPPEPTRVKSPEQILVRSPEPVKWTIPLETGIKWTGTPKIDDTDKQAKESQGSPLTSTVVEEKPSSPSSQQPIELNLSLLEGEAYKNNMDQHEDVLSFENETHTA